KPAAGSLEAAALSLAQAVSGNPDEWERRRSALISMQQAVVEAGEACPAGGGGEKAVFTNEVWRHLKEPLKHTLNDLRSAIVKEACVLLENISTAAGNYMAPLMRDMLNVLLQLMANGNSVIVAQVDSCMKHIISHSRFPRQLKEVDYTVRVSRSKDLRESVGSYVLLMLRKWPAASMDKEAGYLESVIALLLRDASSAARTDARASFGVLMEHWPKRADKVLQGAEPRTARSLREQYGIGEAGITAAAAAASRGGGGGELSLSSTSGGVSSSGRGGGAPSRASKMAGGGRGGGVAASSKGQRKGTSSSEALRAAETAGSSSQSIPPLSPKRHRTTKTATSTATASSRGSKKGTAMAGSSRPVHASPSSSATAASKRRNGVFPSSVAGVAAARLSSGASSVAGPGVAAGAAEGTGGAAGTGGSATISPSSVAKTVNMKKRRPATPGATLTTKSSSKTPSGIDNSSAAKTKRSAPAASAAAAAAAEAAGGVRPLLVNSSSASASASTTPIGSYSSRAALSRPGTAASSPLLVSSDGFLAPGGGGAHVGGSQDDGSVAGSAGLGEGGATTPLKAGDKVRLQGDNPRSGVVRYVGETQFATGVWVGVELSPDADPPGLNDGTVNGIPYFECPPACGVFAKPDMFDLEQVEEEEEVEEEEGDGVIRYEDGRAANGDSDEVSRAAAELLRCHKLFANEALEALKDEMAMIPGLEALLESQQPVPADRVRSYLGVLESAAEAREAAAARLRAQLLETAERYPFALPLCPPSPEDTAAVFPLKQVRRGSSSSSGGKRDGDGDSAISADDVRGGGGGGHDGDGGDGDDEDGGSDGGGGGGGKGDASGGREGEDNNGDAKDGSDEAGAADGEGEGEDEGDGVREDAETATSVDDEAGGGEGGGEGDDAGDDNGAAAGGGRKKKNSNVFGMAGKFLLDVLHIPPGRRDGGGDDADQ
ncbi:unnamed protein product, partial [Pylaiella littoralis]